jgi:ribose transport system permease protein
MSGSTLHNLRATVPIWAFTALLILVAALLSPPFRTLTNVTALLSLAAPLIIVATGQAVAILMAGIDLSVGSVMSLATALAASYATFGGGALVNTILILVVGAAIGTLNGLGVIAGVHPLIMTLSTYIAVRGLALFVLPSPGGEVSGGLLQFVTLQVGVVPVFFIVAVAMAVVVWYATAESTWGRKLYAVGSNASNAEKSGINRKAVILVGFIVSGLLASVAGLALVSRLYSGDPLAGDPYTLNSITAVVLGGVALTGGRGSIIGVLSGALLLSSIGDVLNMFGVSSAYQFIATGLTLIVALYVYNVGVFRRDRSAISALLNKGGVG